MSHSPAPSSFTHGHPADDGDHQMIDPSSVRLPDSSSGSVTTSSSTPSSTPIDSATPQNTHMAGNAASSFWSGARPNEHSLAGAGGPMTPLWPFEAFNPNPSSNPSSSAHEAMNGHSGSAFDTAHTAPASVAAGSPYNFSKNNMLYRSEPMSSGYAHTPSTAVSQWSQTPASTVDPSFMPPPPPNTASASMASPHSLPNASMSYQGHFTGLSPMFAGFTTSSPTIEGTFASASSNHSSAPSPINPQLTRPGGPIRTYSASATIPQGRNRSMMSLGPVPSASPAAGTFNTYPYPSPRMTNPFMNQSSAGNTIQTPTLMRQPSAPVVAEAKRVFHPSPATSMSPAIGVDLTHLPMDGDYAQRMGMNMGMGMGMRSNQPMETKPPRFKPTKEQLEILIKAYEENKNPDGAAREALAKKLGPDVRPKTLQIWFQNRRSKSRAKERDANLPKPLHTRGSSSLGHRSSASTSTSKGGSKGIDREALKTLVHDDDPELTVLPISVLSIANWTRFLMPGAGTSHPDLAASLRMPPSPNPANLQPQLYLYVVHKTDTFRIEIPLIPACVTNLQAASNPSLNAEAVAIRFELSLGSAKFAAWEEVEGRWNEVGDFTGGEASGGGKCELTGEKEILLTSFNKVQQILAGQAYPTPIGSAPLISSGHSFAPSSSSGGSWRFPSISASTSFSSTAPIRTPSLDSGGPPDVGMHHTRTHSAHDRQRSLSHWNEGSTSSSGESEIDTNQYSFSSSTSKGLSFGQSASVDAGQVPLPLATLPETGRPDTSQGQAPGTGMITATGTGMGDYGLSFNWAQLGSPNMAVPPEIETPGTGLSNWGFPITSGSTDHSSSLHTPLTSGMNMNVNMMGMGMSGNSIGSGAGTGNIGEHNYHSFSTLTSTTNPLPKLDSLSSTGESSTSRPESVAGAGSGTGMEGHHLWTSQSSETVVGTPPFELEKDAMEVDLTTGISMAAGHNGREIGQGA